MRERPGTGTLGAQAAVNCEKTLKVYLVKVHRSDNFGFATIDGRLDFKKRMQGTLQGPGPETLIVWKIKEGGALAQWNRENPGQEVFPQDRICNINSEITVEGMQREIRKRRILMRVVRYPERFSVTLDRKDSFLGCQYQAGMMQEMRIQSISEDGALHRHNMEQAAVGLWHHIILPDMCIESVNGVAGNVSAMLEALKDREEEVELVLRRGVWAESQTKEATGQSALLGAPRKAASTSGTRTSSTLGSRGSQQSAATRKENRYGKERPGVYTLTEIAIVAPTVVPCSAEDVVAELNTGTEVVVLQVVFLPDIARVRARLKEPPGWISLLDPESGFRWAARKVKEEEEEEENEEAHAKQRDQQPQQKGRTPLALTVEQTLPAARTVPSSQEDGRTPDYVPGVYTLLHKAGVSPTEIPCQAEDMVGELERGTRINVLQVAILRDCERVRGRLEQPPGWISLLDTTSGLRWAERDLAADVAECIPGVYTLWQRVGVSPTELPCQEEDIVSFLRRGTRIKVLQVSVLEDLGRVRGRLENPPGWISLLETRSGRRWAARDLATDAGA